MRIFLRRYHSLTDGVYGLASTNGLMGGISSQRLLEPSSPWTNTSIPPIRPGDYLMICDLDMMEPVRRAARFSFCRSTPSPAVPAWNARARRQPCLLGQPDEARGQTTGLNQAGSETLARARCHKLPRRAGRRPRSSPHGEHGSAIPRVHASWEAHGTMRSLSRADHGSSVCKNDRVPPPVRSWGP